MDFSNQHPTEDLLERYIFDSLVESETEAIEEHLLVCNTCVDTAEKLLVFVESMRSSLDRRAPKAHAAGGEPDLTCSQYVT